MDKVISANEILDRFAPPLPPPSMSPGSESPKRNRSESGWAFQRCIQEASADAAQTSPPPPESSSSSKPENEAVEFKDGAIPETASFSCPSANLSTDSDDYQAFLKSRLNLACAAVALRRGSLGKPQISASLAGIGSQTSSTSQLECQTPKGFGCDLSSVQDKEVGEPSVFAPLPTTGKKAGVLAAQTTSESSRELSDDAGGEMDMIENMDPANTKRVRRMISNRESARRSRRRKQAHLTELETEVAQLRVENSSLSSRLTDLSQKYNEAAVENRVLKADVETLKAKVNMAEEMVKRVTGFNSVFHAMPTVSATKNPSIDGSVSDASADASFPVQDVAKNQFHQNPTPSNSSISLRPTVINGLANHSSVESTQQRPAEAAAAAATGNKMGRNASMQRAASLEHLQKRICGGAGARVLQCGGEQ